MKRVILVAAALSVTGCANNGYKEYADAVARQSEALAGAKNEQTKALMELARGGDATTKTVAVLMMALNGAAASASAPAINPPKNEVMEWAAILLPGVTGIVSNWFGYSLGKTQSNNATAATTAAYQTFGTMSQAGYSAVAGTAAAGLNTTAATASEGLKSTTATAAAGFAAAASIADSLKPTK